MRRVAHDARKPLIVSIACFSPEEYAKLAGFVADQDIDMIELNLGCPNVWGQDGQKPIASYEPRIVENILALVREEIRRSTSPHIAVAAKISPLPPSILNEVAAVIAEMGIVDVVTATNTLPNGFMWNDTKPAIEAGGGLTGVAGATLKPIAMGVVKQLCEFLPANIDIIAVGGIEYGQDVLDYLNLGPKVKAVQITTAHANRGPRVFGDILTELVSLKEKEPAAP
jgi:dihydroorotate dehydrogenase (fumarate)